MSIVGASGQGAFELRLGASGVAYVGKERYHDGDFTYYSDIFGFYDPTCKAWKEIRPRIFRFFDTKYSVGTLEFHWDLDKHPRLNVGVPLKLTGLGSIWRQELRFSQSRRRSDRIFLGAD